jgi:hypothetical protein
MDLALEQTQVFTCYQDYLAYCLSAALGLPKQSFVHNMQALRSNSFSATSPEACISFSAAYGMGHAARARCVFERAQLNLTHIAKLPLLGIADWGCGQASASCLLLEHLHKKGALPKLVVVDLLDRADAAMQQGEKVLSSVADSLGIKLEINLHAVEFSEALKSLPKLSYASFRIHLFANVLDLLVPSSYPILPGSNILPPFANALKRNLEGNAHFICYGTLPKGLKDFYLAMGKPQETYHQGYEVLAPEQYFSYTKLIVESYPVKVNFTFFDELQTS